MHQAEARALKEATLFNVECVLGWGADTADSNALLAAVGGETVDAG